MNWLSANQKAFCLRTTAGNHRLAYVTWSTSQRIVCLRVLVCLCVCFWLPLANDCLIVLLSARVCLFVFLFARLSIFLPIEYCSILYLLSVRVCLSDFCRSLSVCLSVCLSDWLADCVCLSVSVCLCLSVSLSTFPYHSLKVVHLCQQHQYIFLLSRSVSFLTFVQSHTHHTQGYIMRANFMVCQSLDRLLSEKDIFWRTL